MLKQLENFRVGTTNSYQVLNMKRSKIDNINEISAQLLIEFLQLQANHDISEDTNELAVNGHEALQHAQDAILKKKDLFDLVVLDLHMPISNGYETCKKILDIYSVSGLFQPYVSSEKLKPVMLACSAHLADAIVHQTELFGFDHAMECPLIMRDVEKIIIPLLELRNQKIAFKQ